LQNLRPQVRGTRVAAVAHVQGNALACLGIHGDPHPLRMGFFLHEACQVIGCHCQSLDQDIVLTGDRLDRQMSRQSCQALDEKTSEPLECDPSRTTDTASGNPCHYQAFDKTPLFLREEVWLAVRAKLASTIVAVMVLFAMMNVTIFLVPG